LTWEFIGKVNKYIVTTEPWDLAKTNRSRLTTVLFCVVESIKTVSAMVWPVMPETAERIQDLLGLGKKGQDLKLEDVRQWGKEKPVRSIGKAPHLFQRIEGQKEVGDQRSEVGDQRSEIGDRRSKVEGQRTEGSQKRSAETAEGMQKSKSEQGMVSFKEFQALDIRIGTVKQAETIPGSKKLLKLTVDVGEQRTVVAGLARIYAEADLIGKQVVVLANLEPVTLMGVESRGMILAAEDKSGVHILMPDAESAPGSKVR
jgi:methionyl-tRNA synthetase